MRRQAGDLSRALGGILSREAAEQNVSDTTLGRMVNIPQGQMSAHLRGETALNVEELAAICDSLGLSIVDVMTEASLP